MKRILVGVLWVSLALVGAAFAGDLKAPDAVKSALSKLMHEYGDMGRKVATERYGRLPHDNQEFQEEADASEPAEFKGKVESALADALAASAHVAEVSASHDQGQVKSALEGLGNSLRSLNALFPQGVRAEVAPPQGSPRDRILLTVMELDLGSRGAPWHENMPRKRVGR